MWNRFWRWLTGQRPNSEESTVVIQKKPGQPEQPNHNKNVGKPNKDSKTGQPFPDDMPDNRHSDKPSPNMPGNRTDKGTKPGATPGERHTATP